jgi:imidazolonepropionase-like amidohydrolase
MHSLRFLSPACCILLVIAAPQSHELAAQPQPRAFVNARILTAADQIYDPGTLVIQDGKIVAIGPAGIPHPDGAKVVDLQGKTVIPGLVDSHSHLGVYSRPGVRANSDGNEMTGPIQGIVRAVDSLNPFDPGIRMATAGGITTANIMPGSGNPIGGQTIYVKLRGKSVEEMRLTDPGDEKEGVIRGGLKMANGENPKRSYGGKGQAPGTRMKVAALQREAFLKAKDYQRKWLDYRRKQNAGEEPTPPDRDLALEPLVEVLEGRRTVHFHSHRADDILTTLRLREEFGFDLVIQHGTESFKVLDQIAGAGVPVSMTILDSPGGKAETVHLIEECGKLMHDRGIKVMINTDDPVTESRLFLRTAAIAVRGGLPPDVALKAITRHPAEAMRVDHRVGSLEVGKDADFVVLSGAPFSIYTRVLQTYIDGEPVFDLARDTDRVYQEGGFGLLDASLVPPRLPLVPADGEPGIPPPADGIELGDDVGEFVILAERLHPAAGPSIEAGAVHVREGSIVYAGPQAGFRIPDDVPFIRAVAVTPGLIDTHSMVPLAGEYNIPADQDQDETSDPNQADVRVLDAFNPSEPLLRFLLENGITIVHACPGRQNAIAGQTGVFRTHGQAAEDMTIQFPFAQLFNLGESPKGTYSGRKPATRMGTASLIREQLGQARNRAEKRAARDPDDDPLERNLKLEALESVTRRDVRAMFCAQRADDLQTALRLSREFELDPILTLAAEAYLIRDQLRAEEVPLIVHPTMQRLGEMETFHTTFTNAAHLTNSGVTLSIGSGFEGYVPKTRVIRHEAGLAMTYGLGFDRALRAVTLDAAVILGIDDRFGSLEAGKVADLVLYDGDPFEYATRVRKVIVAGQIVHDRERSDPIPIAQRFYLPTWEIPCCLGF